VAERYWVWSPPIWLDTQPDAPVIPLEILPKFVTPYLRLSMLPHHIPRPFTVLSPESGAVPETVLLLEAAPIGSYLTTNGQIEPFVLPSLDKAWPDGSPLQQLNWLRQVAQLWSPLVQEGVAATLLSPDELRVDHALLRLSKLVLDVQRDKPVSLVELGQQWQGLRPQAKQEIQPYLDWLAKALMQQEISSVEALLAELDLGVRTLAQGLSLAVDWVAYTDQGPERLRNEDACYPEGQLHQVQMVGHAGKDMPLLLVCDGIGGHEQGNVASQTAIEILLAELRPLAAQVKLSPHLVEERLYQALALANDAIAARNNDEYRAARARMGTTVVLALVHFPYVSIAHLGDSRAYRISDCTCYQITLDDDIASRETRLGYALYSEALHIPNGGALIQAMGIGDSAQLYPAVHHLLIDDPAVLLLCSDGLSDYDRVEMLWRQYLSPLVLHQGDLPSTGQELIQQANHLNGHDNVTVGLLRFTPQPSSYAPLPAQALRSGSEAVPAAASASINTRLVAPAGSVAPTESTLVPTKHSTLAWLILLGSVLLASIAIGVAGWVYQFRQPRATAMASFTLPLSLVKVQNNSLEVMTWTLTEAIEVGSFWQAGKATPLSRPQLLELSQSPARVAEAEGAGSGDVQPSTSQASMASSLVPTGSILKVMSRQTAANETLWVRLQVCSIPSGASLDQTLQETGGAASAENDPELSHRLSSPGQFGWVLEQDLYLAAMPVSQPTATQRGDCSL
jgi:serine/threonine protein phosphatase PrpC